MAKVNDLDLSALDRAPEVRQQAPSLPPLRAIALLLAIAVALGGLFFDAIFEALSPVAVVTVLRPIAEESAPSGASEVLLQAAGWIEPDPWPIEVQALASGVLAELLVQESDVVKRGQIIARLIDEEAQISYEAKQAALQVARAKLNHARLDLTERARDYSDAFAEKESLAIAQALLDERRAFVQEATASREEVDAAVQIAIHDLATLRHLQAEEALGPWQVQLAEARLLEAQAQSRAAASRESQALFRVAAAEASLTRAKSEYEARTAARRSLRLAEAEVPLREAEVLSAIAELREARLTLDRMTVKSPKDGVVLAREATVGMSVGPTMNPPILSLYDPNALRVRVDVPQNQVQLARKGLKALIRTESRQNRPYHGEVLRIVDQADLQKVTLEVQVRLLDPDSGLKPDMLTQVAILRDEEASGADRARVLRIPARCLVRENLVYVLSADGRRAESREVSILAKEGLDLLIQSGLDPTVKVIDRGAATLFPGQRVRLEDSR